MKDKTTPVKVTFAMPSAQDILQKIGSFYDSKIVQRISVTFSLFALLFIAAVMFWSTLGRSGSSTNNSQYSVSAQIVSMSHSPNGLDRELWKITVKINNLSTQQGISYSTSSETTLYSRNNKVYSPTVYQTLAVAPNTFGIFDLTFTLDSTEQPQKIVFFEAYSNANAKPVLTLIVECPAGKDCDAVSTATVVPSSVPVSVREVKEVKDAIERFIAHKDVKEYAVAEAALVFSLPVNKTKVEYSVTPSTYDSEYSGGSVENDKDCYQFTSKGLVGDSLMFCKYITVDVTFESESKLTKFSHNMDIYVDSYPASLTDLVGGTTEISEESHTVLGQKVVFKRVKSTSGSDEYLFATFKAASTGRMYTVKWSIPSQGNFTNVEGKDYSMIVFESILSALSAK